MKPLITRDGLVEILILTAVMVFVFIAFYPFSPAARQARNLALAREHATLLTPKIKSDPRFEAITLRAYYGGGGMFWVVGGVPSAEALTDLQALVAESEPPVETKWSVEVMSLPPEGTGASNQALHDTAGGRADAPPAIPSGQRSPKEPSPLP